MRKTKVIDGIKVDKNWHPDTIKLYIWSIKQNIKNVKSRTKKFN